MPLAAFVAITLSLSLGWCFVLTGALRLHWGLRLPIIALVTAALGFYPIIQIESVAGLVGDPFTTELVLAWVQLGVLAVVWLWAIGLLLTRSQATSSLPPSGHAQSFPVRAFWLICGLMAVYEGAALGMWLAYQRAGIRFSADVFTESITGQVFILPLILAVIIYWLSTNLIDWGELGSRAVIQVTQRVDHSYDPRLLPHLT